MFITLKTETLSAKDSEIILVNPEYIVAMKPSSYKISFKTSISYTEILLTGGKTVTAQEDIQEILQKIKLAKDLPNSAI